jgi:hypothetical protein
MYYLCLYLCTLITFLSDCVFLSVCQCHHGQDCPSENTLTFNTSETVPLRSNESALNDVSCIFSLSAFLNLSMPI